MVGVEELAQKLTVLGPLAHFSILEIIFRSFMAKKSSHKHQISNKFQIRNFNDRN
jgi:hypothetical protein